MAVDLVEDDFAIERRLADELGVVRALDDELDVATLGVDVLAIERELTEDLDL